MMSGTNLSNAGKIVCVCVCVCVCETQREIREKERGDANVEEFVNLRNLITGYYESSL